MARHKIACSIPATEVVNSDVEISIWSDESLLGTLHISRGSLDWTPGKSPLCYGLSWERFAELMVLNGNRKPK